MALVLPKQPTELAIAVGLTSTAVLPAASTHQRTFVLLENISDNDIFISFTGAAVLNQGVGLLNRGANLQISDQTLLINSAITAIADATPATLLVLHC